ncbi:homocysteine S-methyltransferase [Granulicella arctica]|uniref:S-methylmethionine:homocysteine methyltransferase n=1 Tax=Granulicella arctica TaxID=940613 RepID=A0A7Y9THH2_9BACT|nr:homocysteine S-methyltransferase [Granulicella arctica]NYF81071.1 homocysteine S-methyltransferase [Granulicella arctica]
MTLSTNSLLSGTRIVDGGMASELEYLGADISGPLWSAHVLEDFPEKIIAVHRAYIEAGAEVILTASYQVSRMGYAEFGLSPERADRALLRAISLAAQARDAYPSRRVLIAASLGPYGAALHNGSEYHGNYGCSFADLVRFHSERIAVLAESGADLLAFETLPSLEEAHAIAEALAPFPHLHAWFCFTCHDGVHVAHGETLRDCAALLDKLPQTVAIGVNCTPPALMESLIAELRAATAKPIVVYPNSGEGWDAEHRVWTGKGAPEVFGEMAAQWFAAGAQLVGGCCRTRPEHIRQVSLAAQTA